MAKLEKWLTISNKMGTALYDCNKYGINLFTFLAISAILGVIAVIIHYFNETQVTTIAIVSLTIFAIIGILLILVEFLVTNIICCRILVPKYLKKQISLVYGEEFAEISISPIDRNDFLIKFKNCTREYALQARDKIMPIVQQTNKDFEKYWGLKLDWDFEYTMKNSSSLYC